MGGGGGGGGGGSCLSYCILLVALHTLLSVPVAPILHNIVSLIKGGLVPRPFLPNGLGMRLVLGSHGWSL